MRRGCLLSLNGRLGRKMMTKRLGPRMIMIGVRAVALALGANEQRAMMSLQSCLRRHPSTALGNSWRDIGSLEVSAPPITGVGISGDGMGVATRRCQSTRS